MPEITLHNIIIYLLVINVVTFLAYFLDKHYAKKGMWRTPEASLLVLVLLGGTLGAIIARKKFRHKTKKGTFRSQFAFIVFLQIIIVIALFMKFYLGINF
jgi:uncharacterized membrane protein YsdA (DUF1294 family)